VCEDPDAVCGADGPDGILVGRGERTGTSEGAPCALVVDRRVPVRGVHRRADARFPVVRAQVRQGAHVAGQQLGHLRHVGIMDRQVGSVAVPEVGEG